MKASVSLSRPTSARQVSGYLTVSQAASVYGISPQTVRNEVERGCLQAVRTSGGHRRISLASLREFYEGISADEQQEEEGGSGIAIYARVSDVSQTAKGKDGKGSLDRQIERLLGEVSRREGIARESIGVYKDVASSFGDREGLNKLVDGIIDGRVKKVYCLYLDRLSRVPALTRLVEHLAERFGVAIVALDTEDSETQDVWQKELLGYITVWCNRQSAAKSAEVTRKDVSPECVSRMIELRKRGLDAKTVWRKLVKEGYKASKKSGEVCELSYCRVVRLLDQNGCESLLTKVCCGADAQVENNIRVFIESRLTKKDGERVSVSSLYPAYVAFCESRGQSSQPRALLGRALVSVLGAHNKIVDGVRQWVGYSLN